MLIIVLILLWIIRVLRWLLFAYVILSWVLPPHHQARETLRRIIDPLLNPIRQILPQTGVFDLSIFVLFILLFLFETLLGQTFGVR